MAAVGWALASAATDVAFLIAAYGVFLALGLQLVFVGTTTAIARRYAGVTGLALGIAYAGPGIGVALALPLAAGLIPELGWRSAAVGFAALSLAGPAVRLAHDQRPGRARPGRGRDGRGGRGRHVEGSARDIRPGRDRRLPGAGPARQSRQRRRPSANTANSPLPDPAGSARSGSAASTRGSSRLRRATPSRRGSTPASRPRCSPCSATRTSWGRWSGGGLSDRFGRRYVGLLCAGLIAVGATAIFAATGSILALAVAGNAIYGFGIGATIAIRSAAFSDVFGGHNFGAIFGVIAIAYPVGGIIVMNAGSILYDRLGSYWPVYGIAMVSLLAWSSALFVAGPRRHGFRKRLRRVRARLPV